MALQIFKLQYQHNIVYKNYIDALRLDIDSITTIEKIPFLPIQFFKNNTVTTTSFQPEVVFESSGTTGDNTSRHFVKKLSLYKKSFEKCFNHFYGKPYDWCILGLLPGYLERQNSSLVTMVDSLIKQSKNTFSGFYLDDHEQLYKAILHNEIKEQPALLIGVTFALFDFAEIYTMNLHNTIVMETGGMKGRREEITRSEIQVFLCKKLGVKQIHSEYGMTELLSQAYSKSDGIYHCPPWMKIVVREENDPFAIASVNKINKPVSGLINVIDLANIYSCSFIATDDVGRLYKNGTFEVLGRSDASDIRGCSLLTAMQ